MFPRVLSAFTLLLFLAPGGCDFPDPDEPDTGTEVPGTEELAETPVYVKASNTTADSLFGTRVVFSDDGRTLAVGAFSENSDALGNPGSGAGPSGNSGAVYVYSWTVDQGWTEQAFLKASNAGTGDFFGVGVALSSDGDTLAVGAAGERSTAAGVGGDMLDDSGTLVGAVYIFERDASGTWTQTEYIKASNAEPGDFFGSSVSLSDDGARLAVGAINEASNATEINGDQGNNDAESSGAVYVFDNQVIGGWQQVAYLKTSNSDADDRLGEEVLLDGSGTRLLVGAPGEASATAGFDPADDSAPDAGAAYVFERGAGGDWSEVAYLKASNAGAGDEFGFGLAASADMSTIAVGAAREQSAGGDPSDDSMPGAGALYVFEFDGVGGWTQQAFVKASNPGAEDNFGFSAAFDDAGDRLLVGAPFEASAATALDGDQNDDTGAAGAAYWFLRTAAGWEQQHYIKASNTGTDIPLGDVFGFSVGLSGDGSVRAIGATGESSAATGINGDQADNGAQYAGAVYLY
ncbi:MAG: integrin [Myxococcota bacterium]